MMEEFNIYELPTAQTRQTLLEQIRDVLKNRQNVSVNGESVHIKKLMNQLIITDRGKGVIPAKHPEDFTLQIIANIGFPPSDKINPEGVMRQVLQEYGWPHTNHLGHIKFYFEKLLKELSNDRIIPVLLFDHPEMLKLRACIVLSIVGEYEVERKRVGIPSIFCIDNRTSSASLPHSFRIELEGEITVGELMGLIEEVSPGYSHVFDSTALHHLTRLHSQAEIQARAKELVAYMRRLGLKEIDYTLLERWVLEQRKKAEREKVH